ncbi:MAG: secretin N-terminal domain-containing protein [Planctomycetaceae bacterium]
MTALTQSGILIISDTGSNLRKINSFLEAAIANVTPDLIFKSYPLTNIDAEEAELMLLAQFGMRQGAGAALNVSAASGRDDRRGQPPTPTAQTPSLKVMSDTRTNSLFVTGSKDDQALVEEIIKAIDISELPDGTPLTRAGASGPYLRVYKVSGRADQAALSINAMMPGVVVNEDNAASTVHIFGTAKQHQQISEWVEAFAAGSGAAGSVAVIPLVKMDPLTAAATLRNLFISEGTAAPTVETDLYGNRIIVKGTATQVDQIKQVLKDLGEDGTGVRPQGEGGNIRRYSLRGRDPVEFMEYLQGEWNRNESTPIRIVTPAKKGPIRDKLFPSRKSQEATEESEAAPAEVPSTTQSKTRSGLRKLTGYVAVRRQDESAGQEKSGTASQSDTGTEGDGRSGPLEGIRIVVDGDELLLIYEDEDALDRLEETMDFLQQSIPYRTRWTVFYLQASDATEAAALLEQLIPSSSVTDTAASSGFSLGAMFRPVTDSVSSLTGLSGIGQNPQTLRIIPDARSNSLLVTGPQSLVDEAEKLLEVLDSNEIPESLRDMQPRELAVEYADIDEVATMVKESFKTYLEPAGGQQQQNNPLAALMGGGGGGGNKKEPAGVQMTVAVDRQNSRLVISSSEALFLKVESLVKDMDDASKSANRTVRYVQLIHSDATMVQNSLSAMFPRVTSSATKTTNNSTSDNTPRPDSSNNSNQTPTNPFGGRGGSTSGNPFGGGGNPFGGGGNPFGGGTSPFGGGGNPFGGGANPFGGGRGGRGGR